MRTGVTAFLRRIFLRAVIVLGVFWGGRHRTFQRDACTFSAVMVERQLGAWLSGDFGYVAHSRLGEHGRDLTVDGAGCHCRGGPEVSRALGIRCLRHRESAGAQ